MDRRKMLFLLGSAAALAGCGTTPMRTDPPPPAPAGDAPAGPDPHAANRVEIVMLALQQIGVPYVWGGTSPHLGFDCSGLVAYVFRQGVQLTMPRVAAEQARSARPIEPRDLRPADLVFYNTLRREFSHVGIYIGDERFVHAPATRGVVRIENMRVDYWRERWNGARRVLA